MSEQGAPGPQDPEGGEQQLSPEQEEMLRQMEEEMRRVRVQDLLAQSVVSILNLAHRRIAKEDERDLEQARIGIDAVDSLASHLEEPAEREVRNALAQIRMLYAKVAGEGGGGEGAGGPGEGQGPSGGQGPGSGGGEPKPGSPPPGLWVPGSG
jgi:hypothetical protein